MQDQCRGSSIVSWRLKGNFFWIYLTIFNITKSDLGFKMVENDVGVGGTAKGSQHWPYSKVFEWLLGKNRNGKSNASIIGGLGKLPFDKIQISPRSRSFYIIRCKIRTWEQPYPTEFSLSIWTFLKKVQDIWGTYEKSTRVSTRSRGIDLVYL